MEIYIIEQYSHLSESSHVHSAYEDEDAANDTATTLNEEETYKKIAYHEWIDGIEDIECPETGDNVFTVTKTILHKI